MSTYDKEALAEALAVVLRREYAATEAPSGWAERITRETFDLLTQEDA